MTAKKILSTAKAEIGNKEQPANSNRVKYNTEYYGREVQGSAYPWCCAFVWWVFKQAGASSLFYGGGKTAYCPTLQSFHKKQKVTDYKPGDIIFFNFSGGQTPKHVGICEKWDGKTITTIDGNTGTTNEANGGAVMRRARDKKYIVGGYRPAYEEDDTVTQKQFDEMMENWLNRQGGLSGSDWSKMADAKASGITDGSRPKAFATREEVATMIMNASEV